MAWQVLVSYLRTEQRGDSKGHLPHRLRPPEGGPMQEGRHLNGEQKGRKRHHRSMAAMASSSSSTSSSEKRSSGFFQHLLGPPCTSSAAALRGSAESLEVSVASSSDATSSSSSSTASTPEGGGGAGSELSRSGSIRVSDSPLHRGSSLGSPAFRRRKMRSRSELHLSSSSARDPGDSNNRQRSPTRRSGLPVPTGNMVNKRQQQQQQSLSSVTIRTKKTGSSNSNSSSPSGSPRTSAHIRESGGGGTAATASPRNSMYKEALLQNHNSSNSNSNSPKSTSSKGVSTTQSLPRRSGHSASPTRKNVNNNSKKASAANRSPNGGGGGGALPLAHKSLCNATSKEALHNFTPPDSSKSNSLPAAASGSHPRPAPPPKPTSVLSQNPPSSPAKTKIPPAATVSVPRDPRPGTAAPHSSGPSSHANPPPPDPRLSSPASQPSKSVKGVGINANKASPGGARNSPRTSKRKPDAAAARKSNLLPAHLNKSSPSLSAAARSSSPSSSTLQRNNQRNISKVPPSSSSSQRHLNHRGTIAGAKQDRDSLVETLLGESMPLAPKAKFRSDGEISICDTRQQRQQHEPHYATPNNLELEVEEEEENHIYESIDVPSLQRKQHSSPRRPSPPHRPPRATVAAKNVVPNSSHPPANTSSPSSRTERGKPSSSTCAGATVILRRGTAPGEGARPTPTGGGGKGMGAKMGRQQQQERLSSEVQCWPWGVPACVNPASASASNLTRSLPPSSHATTEETGSTTFSPHSRVAGEGGKAAAVTSSNSLQRSTATSSSSPPQCVQQQPRSRRGCRDDSKSASNVQQIGLAAGGLGGVGSGGGVKDQRSRQSQHSRATKSASLDQDTSKSGGKFSKARSSSFILQRLGGLRRSLSLRSSSAQKLPRSVKLIRQQQQQEGGHQQQIGHQQQEDWVFFRGFGGKRREDLDGDAEDEGIIEPYAVCHGPLLAVPSCAPQPQAPPRRRRPRRDAPEVPEKDDDSALVEAGRSSPAENPLRRTLSLTDAHFIAQAVYEGDAALIEELYPDFPRSVPIYASVDKAKKELDRRKRLQKEKNRQSHPVNLASSSLSKQQERRPKTASSSSPAKRNKDTPSRSFLTPIPGGGSSGGGEEEESGGRPLGVSGAVAPHSSSGDNNNSPSAAADISSGGVGKKECGPGAGVDPTLGCKRRTRGGGANAAEQNTPGSSSSNSANRQHRKLSPSASSRSQQRSDGGGDISATAGIAGLSGRRTRGGAEENNSLSSSSSLDRFGAGKGVGGRGGVETALLRAKGGGGGGGGAPTPLHPPAPPSSSSLQHRSLPVDPAIRARAEVKNEGGAEEAAKCGKSSSAAEVEAEEKSYYAIPRGSGGGGGHRYHHHHHHRILPQNPSSPASLQPNQRHLNQPEDASLVTFSSPVMFVKQASDLQRGHHLRGNRAAMDLPDLVHHYPSSTTSSTAAAASTSTPTSNNSPSAAVTPADRLLQGDLSTPTPRRVTKVSLDSKMTAGGGEPSPVISPWNTHQHGRPGSTSSNESSSGASTGGGGTLDNQANWPLSQEGGVGGLTHGVHPFAQRTQMHYVQRQQSKNNSSSSSYNQQVRGLLAQNRTQIHQPDFQAGDVSSQQQQQQQGDVVITSSRGGGVTISPSTEVNFASGAAFSLPNGGSGGGRFNLHRSPASASSGARRYGRSESADRLLMDNAEYAGRRAAWGAAPPAKKYSAPAMGRHGRSAAALNGQEDEDFLNGNSGGGLDARSLDESFRKIIARADNSINQAESILSSLRAENSEIPPMQSPSPSTKKTPAVNRQQPPPPQQLQQQQQQQGPTSSKAPAESSAEDSSEPASLCSDIETNIRRLEKTQAKINAALETFRSVQAMSSTDQHHHHHHASHHYPGVELRRKERIRYGSEERQQQQQQQHHYRHRAFVVNEQQQQQHPVASDSLPSFCSLPPADTRTVGVTASSSNNNTLPAAPVAVAPPSPPCKSKTAPGNMEGQRQLGRKQSFSETPASSSSSSYAVNSGAGKPVRKTSLFRRHSFSLSGGGGSKSASPASTGNLNVDADSSASTSAAVAARDSSVWYDGDVESEGGQRSSCGGGVSGAAFDEAHSFSDSEGGGGSGFHQLPLRSRIRGLFGSFGKGRKKVQRSGSKRRAATEAIGVSGDHQPLRLQASLDSALISAPSPHPSSAPVLPDGGPILKATLGEFTRQIESLSAKSEEVDDQGATPSTSSLLLSRQNSSATNQSSGATTYYTAQVSVSSTTTSLDREGMAMQQHPVILRQKRQLAKTDSSNTYASSSNGGFHPTSNRNSVLSGQSISSESYECGEGEEEDDSVSDEERAAGEAHHCSSNTSPRSREGGQGRDDASAAAGGSGRIQEGGDDLTPEQRRERKVFYIAREIMTSEKVFVDILRLINVEFREFVQRARRESKSGILPDADFSRIFSNLPELQTLNEDLLQDFEDRVENWDSVKKIADVIVRKGPFLKLYTTYIREFSSVNDHLDECCRRHSKFGKLVREFEKGERCRNLRLKHFMLKPVQRLPQYRLLLEDYLRHLDPETSPDFDDTAQALRIVSEAADHANDTIKQGDQFRRMLKLQSRLGDGIELIRPGRELVREGELQKISRKGEGPRYFILLSDCLLYCTYSGGWADSDPASSAALRLSYKIPLTALQVKAPPSAEGHYALEFNVTSPVRSCTLRAASPQERNEWLEALNSAVEEHVSRRATFSSVRNSTSSILTPEEAGKIGNSAPVWVPDRRVTMCQNCAVEFSVLVRRHHCRACGKVVCAPCSGNRAPLRYRDFESARVCDECFEFLEKELGPMENLKARFKKRDTSKNGRYVPPRLKVSANGGDGAQMCGYLRRRAAKGGGVGGAAAGGKNKWKSMWFVLKDRVLYAYKASEDTVACETFPILGYQLDTLSEKNFEVYEGENAGLVFVLSHPGSGPEHSLVFCAENDNICEKWMSALREAVRLDSNSSSDSNNPADGAATAAAAAATAEDDGTTTSHQS